MTEPSATKETVNGKNKSVIGLLHKRIGLTAAILVIFISVTGLLLNHIDHWQWLQQPLPAYLSQLFYNVPQSVDSLHWERLLLDLHAGRFFGSLRFVIMDFLGLSVLFLAISGCYGYFKSVK